MLAARDANNFENDTNDILEENFGKVLSIAKDVVKIADHIEDSDEQLLSLYGHVLLFARRKLEVKFYCNAAKKVSIHIEENFAKLSKYEMPINLLTRPGAGRVWTKTQPFGRS